MPTYKRSFEFLVYFVFSYVGLMVVFDPACVKDFYILVPWAYAGAVYIDGIVLYLFS